MSLARPFERLAIVNRGEAAMRLIHAVRELDAAGEHQIRTIALYTDPDRDAMFVREADEAYRLGPAMTVEAEGHRRSGYLDYAALERALVATRAEAAWVGWGFVAEDPAFAELCERLGIVFVGPDASIMRQLGDKIEAKRLAEAAGVPVAPWSGGRVEQVKNALAHASKIGFPLMIKAAGGGGGRGIRRVDSIDQLASAFESAQAEALETFRPRVGSARAVDQPGAPRRGTGDRRRAGHGVAAGRARLLGPAPSSEADRGVRQRGPLPRAGAAIARGLGPPGAPRGLPRRLHGGVPLSPAHRSAVVHGGQYAPSGRASGHRADHRR